jgi:hypothetical protein
MGDLSEMDRAILRTMLRKLQREIRGHHDEWRAACGRKCRAHDSEENNDCPKFQNEE